MKGRHLLILIAFSALAMALVFSIGFVNAVRIGQGSSQTEIDAMETVTPEIEEGANLVLVLGDSIGAGMGDEENLGIGDRYLALLDRSDRDLYSVENFAVSGSETSGMLEVLKSGNLDLAIRDASLILLSIGGNNLNRINEASASLEMAVYEQVLADHRKDLEASLAYIQALNTTADILLLGLYNPYGQQTDDQDLRLLHRWNYESRQSMMTVQKTKMVPLYDLYDGHLDAYLSVDQFHPSAQGYQAIAETIYELMND